MRTGRFDFPNAQGYIRLIEIADKCPVHRTLTSQVDRGRRGIQPG